jgi:AcrR family transcriptional regulator
MDGFERRKEQSKEDIRRAAEELFSRFGADKVSVNDIARKAGVSQATIYNNFGSKENLVHDYRKTVANTVSGRFREILIWKKSYVEKLQSFLQSWIDMTDRYNIHLDAESRFGGSGPGGTSIAASTGDSITGEIEKSVLEFIKQGKEEGHLPPNISDEAIMAYISFFQQGISGNPGLRDRVRHDAGFSNDLLSLFIYGIRGQSA